MDNQPQSSNPNSLNFLLADKKRQLYILDNEIDKAKYDLDRIRKAYAEEVSNLTAYASRLRKYNMSADLLNNKKFEEFHELKEMIGSLEEEFTNTKKQVETYKRDEMQSVDEEVSLKRQKIDENIKNIEKERIILKTAINKLQRQGLNYKNAIVATVSQQEALRSNYIKLRDALRTLSIEKSEVNDFKEKLNDMYVNAYTLLTDRGFLLIKEKQKIAHLDNLIESINHKEHLLSKEISKQTAEIKLKLKEIAERENSLNIRKIQLDIREKGLQKVFAKVKSMQGGII